ncbi:MAG: pilus assembly protein N-terminal domain-containing protein [Capnocytophaga felis]|nr:pilus assembly protein N-terminal domain-containing protein [Capnocytophaga felis]
MLGLVLMGLTTTFVSCDKDDKKEIEKPVYKEIKVDKSSLTLSVGNSETLEITEGNGGYKVTSSDESKATASIKNNTQIVVEGKKSGEVTLTITDAQSKQASIKVVVFESIALDSKTVIAKKGTQKTVSIQSGSGTYSVDSKDKTIATATLSGTTSVVISAVSNGNTTIVVTDTKTNKTEEIAVTVSELSVAKNTVELKVGATENVAITSGSGTYEIASDNEEIASAEIINGEVKVSAKAAGTATITLTDGQTDEAQEISVKVMEELRMEKETLSVKNKDHEVINILGADNTNGDYQFEISTQPADVVEVKTQWFDATQGHHLKVTGLKPGEATVTVKDKQTNQVVTFKVVVTPADFFLPKTQVSLVVPASETINIQGNGRYEVSSEKASVATATENNGVLTIVAVSEGSTNISVKDIIKNETKTIAVTVTVKSSFTVDADGVLTAVDPSAIVAEMVIPENVKEFKGKPFEKNKNTIQSVTMESVEKINEWVFAFQSELTTVTVGDKVKSIDNFAFALCRKLSVFKIKAQTPPTLNGNPFMSSSEQKTLKVPTGKKAAYEEAGWSKYFTTIEEEN